MRYILEDNSPLSTLKCNPEGIEFLKEEKTKKCFKCSNYAEMTFILTQHFKTGNRYRSVSVCKEHLTNIIKEKKDDRTIIQFPSNID